MSWDDIRDGMAVFDSTGRLVGQVEALHGGYFFLTHEPRLPLLKERIVVEAAESVASVDADGVHLRHDPGELLVRKMRPAESQCSHQVAPGEDISSVHRGDEDRRPLDADDVREQRQQEPRGGLGAADLGQPG